MPPRVQACPDRLAAARVEHPCDGDSLLLPTGKPLWIFVNFVTKTNLLEHLAAPDVRVRPWQA
jgi:hypothetical protein